MNEPTMITGIEELGIFERDADAWVSSQDVAKLFGKHHTHVIRAIEKAMAEVSDQFTRTNFGFSKYKDGSGKSNKAYRLNRKAFAYVAMGFTGKKAAQFKEAYIEAFERMSDLIFSRRVTASGHREMSAAISDTMGSDPAIFAAESDRVNLAVLDMTSREFRSVFSVPKGKNPRDAVPQPILEKIDAAQRLNAALIRAGVSGDERTRVLEANYQHRGE